MANLRVRMMLPDGFTEENILKLRRTLSTQKGIDLENGSGCFLVISDGTSLKSIKGAKLTLDQYGIKLAAPTYNQEDEEDFIIDDGSPLPDYAEDCNCSECQAARYRAEKRRHAQERQTKQALDALMKAAQSTQQDKNQQLKKMLEEAVQTMLMAKRRL